MTAGVLLCAGGSSRFHGPRHKLLSNFRGEPLVYWALSHLVEATLDEVIVVVGGVDLAPILHDVVIVENLAWNTGQASSLRAGVDEAKNRGHTAVVVGLGDQPFIPGSAWRSVADSSSPIAVSTFDGRRSPPVKLASSVWDLLPQSGDVGARELMSVRPDLVTEITCEGDPADIDTLDDWYRWR
jgi:CTP:molybdopterin cytidylyltransferase MocA